MFLCWRRCYRLRATVLGDGFRRCWRWWNWRRHRARCARCWGTARCRGRSRGVNNGWGRCRHARRLARGIRRGRRSRGHRHCWLRWRRRALCRSNRRWPGSDGDGCARTCRRCRSFGRGSGWHWACCTRRGLRCAARRKGQRRGFYGIRLLVRLGRQRGFRHSGIQYIAIRAIRRFDFYVTLHASDDLYRVAALEFGGHVEIVQGLVHPHAVFVHSALYVGVAAGFCGRG